MRASSRGCLAATRDIMGSKCVTDAKKLKTTYTLRQFAGLIGPLSKRREAALRETAPVTASGFTRPRCRVQAETSRRSRLSFHTTITTKQQPRKSTQRRDISKATSADPQADIGADPEAESEGCSAPLSADSPQHLFAAARAAALQAGEDQQSAKFSAAIAADAASVAASTAGLARASAHDAAVAAERAATWAADAADELAEAAAASEDLVLKLYELQTAGGPKAKQSAVKALLTAAQAAAKAADTLKQSLADAAPQTVRHTSASAAQRSPPALPAATADSFDGPARAAQLQTDQETISEQHMNGSKPPSASSSVADADPGGSAPRSEAAATRQRLEGSETMSASLDAAAAVQSTATATIGPASETANESTEEPIDDAIVEPADEASKDATVQRDDETAVEPTEEPTDDADLEAADEPTADATFDTNPESAVEPAEANLESAVEPAEDLSEVTRKDKVPDMPFIICKALHLISSVVTSVFICVLSIKAWFQRHSIVFFTHRCLWIFNL